MNKMWHIHTMEYYSTLKGEEILSHTTQWIEVEDNVLQEISL